MTDLEYNGTLTSDIKLMKKTSEKREKIIMGLDLTYLFVLIAYLIYIFARCANGLGNNPTLTIFINSLIITRNLLYIKKLRTKNKAAEARARISYLINKIFHIKSQDNNLSGHLYTDDFENAVVVKNEEHVKQYDENDDVRSYVDTITNYIYLLDSEDVINVLKEVKKTVQEPDEEKMTETTLELLSPEEFPENLPVKQVLKLRKDN